MTRYESTVETASTPKTWRVTYQGRVMPAWRIVVLDADGIPTPTGWELRGDGLVDAKGIGKQVALSDVTDAKEV